MYKALEEQRIATQGSPEPLPSPTTGGFPRAEFFAATMPRLAPHLDSLSPYPDVGSGGVVSGGGGGSGVSVEGVGAGCAVNVLAMERLGDNLMALSQVKRLGQGGGWCLLLSGWPFEYFPKRRGWGGGVE